MHFGPSEGDIRRELDNAAQVWEELRAEGCELSFDLDGQGSLVITLRDVDGSVLRDVAATEAAEIASARPGAAVDRLLRS
jgi:hypothetical protein